jgi:molybdopterin molybdotransferase
VIPVEEALERILSRVGVLGDEQVPLRRSLHRVLAEPAMASLDLPPWPNSSMDGYALRGADTESASPATPARLVIAGRVAAGHVAERPLRPGEAFRIFTGGPLPEGADSVIPQEDVRREGATLIVPRAVATGDYVRPRGEDVRAGDAVLEPGRVLGPRRGRYSRRPRPVAGAGDEAPARRASSPRATRSWTWAAASARARSPTPTRIR